MSAIPTFSNPCLAPFVTPGSPNIYLAGVSDTAEGRLEVYSINVANIAAPTATLQVTNVNALKWKSSSAKHCSNYPGDTTTTSTAALHVQQFGPYWSFDSNIRSTGVVDNPTGFEAIAWVSPKNYAVVGHAGPIGFVAALTNGTSALTGSPWAGVRLNGTDALAGSMNPRTLTYPTSSPLVSVGTFTPSSVSPARGYLTVFDTFGSGRVYPTTGYDRSNPLITDLLTIGLAQSVDMDNVKLTSEAVPVTAGNVAYILDKGADGNTVVYSITPGQSTKLQVVANNGAEVLPFASNIVATTNSQNTQIITYRVSGLTATFNSFDASTGKWAGLGLAPAPPKITPGGGGGGNGGSGSSGSGNSGSNGSSDGGGSNTGAIVGGILGGLVVIALVAFLFIRNRRQKKAAAPAAAMVPTYYASDVDKPGAVAAPAAYPAQTTAQAYAVPQQQYDPAAQYQQQQQPSLQQQQQLPHQQSPYQPQVFPQQQQQVQQVQPGYDPRLSYNPYSVPPGQTPLVQSNAVSPTIFQASTQQQSVYSVSPAQGQQQPYVYSPAQSAAPYSQPSPVHYPAQTSDAPIPAHFPAPANAMGSPSQTPVVYTPPTATGYSQ
ncbi:hypothetical protein BGW39_002103 [Mortierella sp. 14UC]|nr:hypothetical protein BGW39_002103 [Mortierella sp. 14UC]